MRQFPEVLARTIRTHLPTPEMLHTMDADRWNQIQLLFKEVVDLPEADRERSLRKARLVDPNLEEEVRALLTADSDTGPLLDGVATDALDFLDEGPHVGQQVGRYQLIRRIGTGGMGAVYLAERADGAFTQRVALKLIKRGMDSERILRRFQSERQILARLTHPGG